jgi:alcohol dehydrogenase (cytochrome c)
MKTTALALLAIALLWAVASSRGVDADAIPGADWAGYNKTLDGHRFSSLTQINASNVSTLKEVCRVEVSHRGSLESGLVLARDTLYVTAERRTLALDPVTCAVRWLETYHPDEQGLVAINRGVAYSNGLIFRGTEDARVIALNAATGDEVWRSIAGDPGLAEYIAGAPLVWNGIVFVGTGGSEFGIRGRVMAFDARNGRELWRFNTIPAPGEVGAETWANHDWARHGGGGTWSSFALDPVSAELFVPVGNPIPDFSPQDRPGANLFTDSVVVLDARSGTLNWWYQLTPADSSDWDLAAAPILLRDAQSRSLVAAAGKDGYLHVIDRDTHQLRYKVATTTVGSTPAPDPPGAIRRCPGAAGGTEWNGPAFDPQQLIIVTGALDMCTVIVSEPGQSYVPGQMHYGGKWQFPAEAATGWLTAVDASSGQVRWRFHTEAPPLGAITLTAGGLVLAGDNAGNLLVLASATGKLLRRIATNGSISGGIITYEVAGREYLALTSGSISRTGFGAVGRPSVIIMTTQPEGAQALADAADAGRGHEVYLHTCIGCHASDGAGVPHVTLAGIRAKFDRDRLRAVLLNPPAPMPRVFPSPMDDDDRRDLRDLVEYLEKW